MRITGGNGEAGPSIVCEAGKGTRDDSQRQKLQATVIFLARCLFDSAKKVVVSHGS